MNKSLIFIALFFTFGLHCQYYTLQDVKELQNETLGYGLVGVSAPAVGLAVGALAGSFEKEPSIAMVSVAIFGVSGLVAGCTVSAVCLVVAACKYYESQQAINSLLKK